MVILKQSIDTNKICGIVL